MKRYRGLAYLEQRVRRKVNRDLGRVPTVDGGGMVAEEELPEKTDAGCTCPTEDEYLVACHVACVPEMADKTADAGR
jgi:hypothetical protein